MTMEIKDIEKTVVTSGNSLVVRITQEAKLLNIGAGDTVQITIRRMGSMRNTN